MYFPTLELLFIILRTELSNLVAMNFYLGAVF